MKPKPKAVKKVTRKKPALFDFRFLSGVKGGKLKGPIVFRSVTSMMGALGTYRAVSWAGDAGAVMLWIDDSSQYRAEFCRYQVGEGEVQFKTKTALRDWLAYNLPRCEA